MTQLVQYCYSSNEASSISIPILKEIDKAVLKAKWPKQMELISFILSYAVRNIIILAENIGLLQAYPLLYEQHKTEPQAC